MLPSPLLTPNKLPSRATSVGLGLPLMNNSLTTFLNPPDIFAFLWIISSLEEYQISPERIDLELFRARGQESVTLPRTPALPDAALPISCVTFMPFSPTL